MANKNGKGPNEEGPRTGKGQGNCEVEQSEGAPQQQGIPLSEATLEQLKAEAFDVEQNIKALQRNYQIIINELQKRTQNGTN